MFGMYAVLSIIEGIINDKAGVLTTLTVVPALAVSCLLRILLHIARDVNDSLSSHADVLPSACGNQPSDNAGLLSSYEDLELPTVRCCGRHVNAGLSKCSDGLACAYFLLIVLATALRL